MADNPENVFVKCPKYDRELHDWSLSYPRIREAFANLGKNRESVFINESALALANIGDILNPKEKLQFQRMDYAFPEDQIIEIVHSYAEDDWTPEMSESLRNSIVQSREAALNERLYTNNLVRDWNEYEVPTVDTKSYYYLTNSGVFRVVETINEETRQSSFATREVCRTPFILCGISEPLNDDTVYYKIRYATYNGTVKEFWASQSTILSRKEMKTIFNAKGINCPENVLLIETIDYISRSIAEFGSRLKKEFSAKRNGWNEDKTIFVIGNHGITSKGSEPILSVAEDSKGFTELEKKGNVESWATGVKPLLDFDVIRFKCYDAMTAPLKAVLGVESHATDHYGNTSCGKTLSAWVALSMIGNAEKLTIGAKSTTKGILVRVRDFSDLPILIDESSDAGDHLADLVYTLTSNKGRVKSTVTGGRDGGEEYHTTALFTGERPIRDCLTNSGQQYRVNELNDTLPDLPTQEINGVKKAIANNHGHIIELYIHEIFKELEAGTLSSLYDDCFDKLPETNSNIEGRSRSIFACIMTAGTLLERIFQRIGLPERNPSQVVSKYFQKCILDNPVELEYLRALRVVLDWVHSDYGRFAEVDLKYDDVTIRDKSKRYGWIDNDFIDIIGSEFTKKMKDEGFSPTKIKQDWGMQGITLCNDPTRKGACRFTREKKTVAGVRINRAIAEELTGLYYDDTEISDCQLPQDEKIKWIMKTIQYLTERKGEADIQLIRQIENIPDLDDMLNILTKYGKILKINQTSYKYI